ncbi:NAD-dependent succinate-semialdehyde dehydrogenase [Rhodococcus fascians]|nr:NAD-dependent succinate-semialdehyde dehydrogenase [Rhodococcus fascians]MBY3825741.1 NAD-dependent succinate-semialdehyde dehydrogenase [Rhodococcus fascians]MBY3836203.1 NAD-dependent succinate-semialdehyde dehydrogenase [Rhodococcus fascians]MBY3866389.1 NAD-dependent succinate-semialdehyde dehydrogenase [Rhodococcus fascians]MBY3884885.1 NAD-dependent succinate-semialdehyde dehydrogenase [Rhodococcus fascians]
MSNFSTINPKTGEPIAEYTMLSAAEALESLGRSAEAYSAWSTTSMDDRAGVLSRVAKLHRERKAEIAHTVALEMGKPISQTEGEIELAASVFDYYADNAASLLRDEELDVTDGGRAVVRTAPIGPVLGIMPWNFPLYQVARFVAPNLILGNTVLLKHARSCTQTSLLITSILEDAAAPAGVFENLVLSSQHVESLIADPRLRGVSLTGSEEAGRTVAEQAGKHLKKCVLELGGSDPLIVLADADLEQALDLAAAGRFANAGQSCTSSKRIIVHTDVWDQFVDSFIERARTWAAGDPLELSTKLGPMASIAGRDEIAEQVDDAAAKGAVVHLGGAVPEGPGAYYPATVLTGVTSDMRAYSEELFGPVAVLYKVESTDEAVELANDSRFGLGSAVFTQNPDTALDIANRLEAGMVGLNSLIRSKPNLPFGGVKASGIGRELGRLGLDEFSNKKLLRIG